MTGEMVVWFFGVVLVPLYLFFYRICYKQFLTEHLERIHGQYSPYY